MKLPNSYIQKYTAVPAYFDAILDAQAPERFTLKFLENLGFMSSNDRLLIGVLKELGFLNTDGVPTARYYEFLDKDRSREVLGEGIKDMYEELFAIVKDAQKLSANDVKNKLRTLYAGKKSDNIIERVSKTFAALCDYAEFKSSKVEKKKDKPDAVAPKKVATPDKKVDGPEESKTGDRVDESKVDSVPGVNGSVSLDSLQYHINIVLPESRDQAIYDAIFRSLREHLGGRNG